jgi:hypothetical protein
MSLPSKEDVKCGGFANENRSKQQQCDYDITEENKHGGSTGTSPKYEARTDTIEWRASKASASGNRQPSPVDPRYEMYLDVTNPVYKRSVRVKRVP